MRDSLKDQPTYSPLSHGSVPSLDCFKELTKNEDEKGYLLNGHKVM